MDDWVTQEYQPKKRGNGRATTQGTGGQGNTGTQDHQPSDLISGYDPAHYYIESQDKRGHGTTYHVKIPEHLVAATQRIREVVPVYRSTHDLVRDSLVHRIMYLDANLDLSNCGAQLSQAISIEHSERTRATVIRHEALVQAIRDCGGRLLQAGDMQGLRGYVSAQRVISMGYEQPWRDKALIVLGEWDYMMGGGLG